MVQSVFIELGKILVLTLLISGLMKLLRQPILIGYVISGIIAGPVALNIISSADTLATFAQMGVVFLLFMVGLNLNPRIIKDVGKVSLITGVGQVLFTSVIGFFISRLLGFSAVTSMYISVALTFSSTIIIMKLLSDKKDLESLHGRIAIGFLIVQDFIAIAILMVISSIGRGISLKALALESLLKGTGGLALLFVLAIYILPRIMTVVARSQEFLLLFSVSWCFAVASVFNYINFSIEAGALLAGITLSLTPYHYEISSKMRPLRDFFLMLFFILLGSQMVFSNIMEYVWPIILLSLFVMLGNPVIVMLLMGFLGYTKRSSFLAGLTVAQISEFSLVLIALGVSVGHLKNDILSMLTAIGLITIAGSTYMILYADVLFVRLSPYLGFFERRIKKPVSISAEHSENYQLILFGYNRLGSDIMESLAKLRKKLLVVDFDPEVIVRLSRDGRLCKYGDANDSELLDALNFSKVKMVISTIPVVDTNLLLISKVRQAKKNAIVVVLAHQIDDAIRLYEHGASYVIMPHYLGGRHVSMMIKKSRLNVSEFLREKSAHMHNLKRRKWN